MKRRRARGSARRCVCVCVCVCEKQWHEKSQCDLVAKLAAEQGGGTAVCGAAQGGDAAMLQGMFMVEW